MRPNNSNYWRRLLAPVAVPLLAALAYAAPSDPAGHWEGNIQIPDSPLGIRLDLDKVTAGAWSGTIDIPVQALRGFKLSDVSVQGSAVSFTMAGIPGNPKFIGQLEAAGSVISGKFTQGAQTFPFKVERKTKIAASGETPSSGVPGKGLAGFWQGSLKPTPVMELRLVLELTNTPAGKPAGVLVSIDQGGARIPITTLEEKDGAVRFETRSIGGVYDGKLSADGSELAGEFKQNGSTLPLVFKRLAKAPSFSRSQEPKKPYPYREEEVVVENKPAKVRLAGTFTFPSGGGSFPAVVLITGSGAQDRDEALLGHRPFLVLADHLTRRGIAVLRCDDRGFAKSTGDFAKATDSDFVEDTLACVAWLRARPEASRIGLIGHSEGGIVAPRVAIKCSDVSFIVLLAGVGVPMEELLIRQAEDISRVMGVGPEPIAKNSDLQRAIFRLLKQENNPDELENKLRDLFHEQTTALTEEQRKALSISDAMIDNQIKMVRSLWFREILAYDPAPTLRKVKCAVLALNGEKDLQVSAKENLAAIHENLVAGGNQLVKTLALPGLNHLFQTCQTGSITEYAQIDETFNPKALQTISDWILQTCR